MVFFCSVIRGIHRRYYNFVFSSFNVVKKHKITERNRKSETKLFSSHFFFLLIGHIIIFWDVSLWVFFSGKLNENYAFKRRRERKSERRKVYIFHQIYFITFPFSSLRIFMLFFVDNFFFFFLNKDSSSTSTSSQKIIRKKGGETIMKLKCSCSYHHHSRSWVISVCLCVLAVPLHVILSFLPPANGYFFHCFFS